MKQLDLNKSGFISTKEYELLEWYLKRTGKIHGTERGSGSPGTEDVFGMYDNNTDGVLDKAELGKYLISLDEDLAVSINWLR